MSDRAGPGGWVELGGRAEPGDLSVHLLNLAPGVRVAFTGRRGGVSRPPYDSLNMGVGPGDSIEAVTRNRERVAAACGLAPDRMIWMRQVHGAVVARVTEPAQGSAAPAPGGAALASGAAGPASGGAGSAPGAAAPGQDGRAGARADAVGQHGDPSGPWGQPGSSSPPSPSLPGCDAQFTSVPGLALGVLSADCPAVLLADPDAGLAGAAHSGRQGTARGVVPALVRAMTAAGAEPARMRAVIGPGICGGCYEVPAQMRDEVAAAVPRTWCITRAGAPGLDLRSGIAAQLAGLGVPDVRVDSRCTAEDPDLYSYRRDGRTGRFAGLVWLAP